MDWQVLLRHLLVLDAVARRLQVNIFCATLLALKVGARLVIVLPPALFAFVHGPGPLNCPDLALAFGYLLSLDVLSLYLTIRRVALGHCG